MLIGVRFSMCMEELLNLFVHLQTYTDSHACKLAVASQLYQLGDIFSSRKKRLPRQVNFLISRQRITTHSGSSYWSNNYVCQTRQQSVNELIMLSQLGQLSSQNFATSSVGHRVRRPQLSQLLQVVQISQPKLPGEASRECENGLLSPLE